MAGAMYGDPESFDSEHPISGGGMETRHYVAVFVIGALGFLIVVSRGYRPHAGGSVLGASLNASV